MGYGDSDNVSCRHATLSDTVGYDLSDGYDTAGRLAAVGTTIPGLSKKTTSYKLDKAGNRTQLKWPDGYFVNFGYDALNRMWTATDSTAALATYAYDNFSRRSGVTYVSDGLIQRSRAAGSRS